MKSILVNLSLLPILLVALPLIVLLSCAPPAGRMQRFRQWMMDWLDEVTNDYGAELIYLEGPSGADVATETVRTPHAVAGHDATAASKLIVFPLLGNATRSKSTDSVSVVSTDS